MTTQPHPFNANPGRPEYCIEGLSVDHGGISCGRVAGDPIHQTNPNTALCGEPGGHDAHRFFDDRGLSTACSGEQTPRPFAIGTAVRLIGAEYSLIVAGIEPNGLLRFDDAQGLVHPSNVERVPGWAPAPLQVDIGQRVIAIVDGCPVSGSVISTAHRGTQLLSIAFFSDELGHRNRIDDAILVEAANIRIPWSGAVHPFHPSRPNGTVCVYVRVPEGRDEVCGYPAGHPLHAVIKTERVEVGTAGCNCPITEEMTVVDGELRSTVEGTERVEHHPRCWEVKAHTPAEAMCCAAESGLGVTTHEPDCPRFTPAAIAYRKAQQAEREQRLTAPAHTPAEARTAGRSDTMAAIGAEVATLRKKLQAIAMAVASARRRVQGDSADPMPPLDSAHRIATETAEVLDRIAAWAPERVTMPGMPGMAFAYMHECGQVDWFASAPDHGGCDRCESGSNNPRDWRALYVQAGR